MDTSISKTLIIYADTNNLIQQFENQSDQKAEAKITRNLATEDLPGAPDQNPATTDGAQDGTTPNPPSGGGTAPGGGTVQERLERLLERQRELLEETEALRDALREGAR